MTHKFPDTNHRTLPRDGSGYAVFLENRGITVPEVPRTPFDDDVQPIDVDEKEGEK